MDFKGNDKVFYDSCFGILRDRHGDSDYWVPMLERFVMVSSKLRILSEQIMDEAVTTNHTNKAEKTNEVSSPKVRMFALFNEQAHKLAVDLGLNLAQAKAGRKPKTAKDRFASKTMKIA